MKNTLILFAIVFLSLAGCRQDVSIADAGRFTEVRNGDNSYTVLYINTENGSSRDSRAQALHRAAELTVDSGYRYFYIDSESSVTVASSENGYPGDDSQFPGNMYEELIVEKNFSRRSLESRSNSIASYYPGYKIVFHFSEDHSHGNAMDACDYVPCAK